MGFIKLSEEITVTCSSVDAVSWALIVEVNGLIVTDSYKDSINTKVPGKFIFKANSFSKDQNIRLTCLAT